MCCRILNNDQFGFKDPKKANIILKNNIVLAVFILICKGLSFLPLYLFANNVIKQCPLKKKYDNAISTKYIK